MKIAFKIHWEESERGWGSRPDGTSAHLTIEDANQYIDDHWSKFPDEVPDEYSRPFGKPEPFIPSDEIYEKLLTEKNIWLEHTKWV